MADLSVQDIVQQYNNCLIFYKGKPHKVKRCGQEMVLMDVATQRNKSVEFKLKDFSGIPVRLGYVNIEGTATYVSRKPLRTYYVGINQGNCDFSSKYGAKGLDGGVEGKIYGTECPEYGDMLFGHYPSVKKALEEAIKWSGAVAFDKQFCVDCFQVVYYKNDQVGIYDKGVIKFSKGKEYLSILLDGGYEKDLRTFSKEAA